MSTTDTRTYAETEPAVWPGTIINTPAVHGREVR
ncbi:hypothetical protein FB565_000979 [Actinoplanes lutulentus]|uniref:Uncharacterized protein n=1 Tax=Actinoplanes lutulentus TaxID=1287878 RepID=A0A327ZAR2_9ACTN|nr:hypothetical protein [Actinoplanes lutulentus]RAK36767.1 hypothetical protein B0I29_10729 [Actinoplanes lutulentus]